MRKPKSIDIITILLVLNLFLMRPSALGQSFQGLSLIIAVILLSAHIYINRARTIKTNATLNRQMRVYVLIFIAFWTYAIPISISGISNLEFVAKEFVSAIIIFICYGMILVRPEENRKFFSVLCTIISVIGWSSCITLILGTIFGFEPLFITAIKVAGYEDQADETIRSGALYFPFSMLYSRFTSGEVELMRFNGFFREAGIYQAVACFCIAYEYYTRKSKIIIFGSIFGAIAAFSSLGILLLLMTIVTIFVTNIRSLPVRFSLLATALVLAYPIAMYTPYIGLESKQETHSTSITDRTVAMENGWETLAAHPMGSGMFSSLGENSGINLIASTGELGIIGFLLQCLMISGFRLQSGQEARRRLLACAPLLLTALISQPIAGSPMMYVLPMSALLLSPAAVTSRKKQTHRWVNRTTQA